MRPIHIAIVIASLAALSACAAQQTETTAPTVSYSYSDDDDYDVVEEKAELYRSSTRKTLFSSTAMPKATAMK